MRHRKSKRILRTENLEDRRCLAASFGWDGPGLGGASLTYTVNANGSGLGQQAAEEAIDRALDAWSDVADISFTQVNQVGLRDSLDISFRRLDGPGGTLAQAYFPDDVNSAQIAGDIEFDTSENWEVGNALGSRAFDLVQVAIHEIGHALGLEHDHTHDSILRASVSPQESFSALGPSDVDAILRLYAPATTTSNGAGSINPPTTNPTIQPNVQTNLPDTNGSNDTQPTPTDDNHPTQQPPATPIPWLRLWNRWVNRFRQRFHFNGNVPGDHDSGQDTSNTNPTITPTITIRWFVPRIR